MLERVRFRARDGVVRVGETVRLTPDRDGSLVLPVEQTRDASLNDLGHVLRRMRQIGASDRETAYFTLTPGAEDSPDTAVREAPELMSDPFDRSRMVVNVVYFVDPTREPSEDEIRRLVDPIVRRHRARFDGIWTDIDYPPDLLVGVLVSLDSRRRSIGDAYELGRDLHDLLFAIAGSGELTARSAFDLVQAGRAAVLVGQRESSWLDVKEPPYRLDSGADAFEAAKDVVAFANTGEDALIVLGLRSRRDRNGDYIDSARPFPLRTMDVDGLRKALNDRIVPAILDLRIGVVETRGGYGYGYIFIPAQPPEARPILVAGTVIDGDYIGSHLTIPFRAGEDTVFANPAQVHTLIAAGRVALRSA